MEFYKNLWIIFQEMSAHKIFYKNKKNTVGSFFNGLAGMLTNYLALLIYSLMILKSSDRFRRVGPE